jgi:tryptophanyl-tRNA synthetase
MGLMTYPILQAADIFLYGTHFVPVGEDQRQHIELSRDLAERFNNAYSPTFVVPEAYIQKAGAKIMDLQHPEKKMSKSADTAGGCIFFGDTSVEIIKKINRAVTDSESVIKLSDKKPGIKNLLTIYSACTGVDIKKAEACFADKSYAEFKKSVGEAVVALFAPMQAEYQRLMADKAYLQGILKTGAEQASYKANKTLAKVMKKMGFSG